MAKKLKKSFTASASPVVQETETEAERALTEWDIPYKKQPDGTLLVEGSISIQGKGLTRLPDLTRVVVKGSFFCCDNRLTSLAGSPQYVGVDFVCSDNLLTSLEGGPAFVGHSVKCDDNRLVSLKGAPRGLKGYFSCSNNLLASLEDGPETVGGNFWCDNNRLTSLIGGPVSVGNDFVGQNNKLTSLTGSPVSVAGSFFCYNNKLTSLAGAPASVGKKIVCIANPLSSLEGAPELFGSIESDLGVYGHWADIPEELLFSPETRARTAQEERCRFIEQSVVLDENLVLRKTSIAVKKRPRPASGHPLKSL